MALLLILAGALLSGLALGALCLAEVNPPKVRQDSDAVIVLGCQVYSDGQLSPQLKLRLQAALDTYRDDPRLIVTTGGQGEGEPAPEGQVMRDWLISQGLPEEDVIAECESVNTRQNLLYAKALLPEGITRVTVVTSDFHLPRALALAHDLGLDADGIGSPCRPEIGFWVKNHGREVLAWGKYLVEKVIDPQ
ncbi:MAG: YdcF family protein [Clostridia bacterium]|nr:YdcF family protein [Clostridia bacterium]MBR4537528.1 YdcF family protein [Clostridia bacterium]